MANEAPPVLEGLRVASPCTASWEAMAGDARVRHCGACRLNVYDLSAMSRREAEDLVRRSGGRLCVRFYRRADGTVLTQDCPVGLRAVRRRLALLGSAMAAMFLAAFAAGCGRSPAVRGGRDPITGRVALPGAMGKPAVQQPVMGGPMPVMGDVADPRPLQGEVVAPAPHDR